MICMKMRTVVKTVAIVNFLLLFLYVTSNYTNVVTIEKNGEIVTVKQDNGLITYEGNDDVVAIENAIQTIGAGTIVFKKGVYNIDSTIALKSNLTFVGEDGVVFMCFNGVAFDTGSDGYSSSTISLTRSVSSHDTDIELSSTTGLKINDYVKISDDLIVGRYKNGEIAKIIYVNGNTITVDRPLYDSYTTSRNAKIRKISMFENIVFDKIKFVGYGMETYSVAIRLNGARNIRISNSEFADFGVRALGFQDSLDSVIENNTFRRIFYIGLGYSVSLSNACDNITIRNNSFLEKGRHYIATGGSTGTRISDGLIRKVYVLNNIFENSTDEAVNTHQASRGVVEVSGNRFTNTVKGVEFANTDSVISNNDFINCGSQCIQIWDYTGFHIIKGNYFENSQKKSISIEGGVESIIEDNIFNNGGYINTNSGGGNSIIRRNRFMNYESHALYLGGTVDANVENITISNNVMESGATIKIMHCKNFNLTGNKINSSVQLLNCGNVKIDHNNIVSKNNGLRILDARGKYTIVSNEINASNRGISLENTIGNTIIDKIIIKYTNINAPTPIYNGGYSNIIIEGPLTGNPIVDLPEVTLESTDGALFNEQDTINIDTDD